MRCESVSKSGYLCAGNAGHKSAHFSQNKNTYWTDDAIIWDYELNDYRAIS